jgi:hypothetical protein
MDFLKNWVDDLLVAAATGAFIYVWKEFIHPYVLGILQRTPNLSGRWEGFNFDEKGNENQTSMMEIKQLGTNIYATVHRRARNRERIFKYQGTISSGQVLLIWKESKGNGYNMGTMTLLLSSDLLKLKGKTTYHHHDKGIIVSNDRIYKKLSD